MQIVIPENSLVLLCGPAGCGKSTFAAKHFLATQIVSSDECRARLSDDATNQEVTPLAFELMQFIVEKRLKLGRLTVGDATHLKREDRRPMVNISRRFGFNVVAIVFSIPLEVCLSRNAGRVRVVPEDALRAQHAQLGDTLASIQREGFDFVFVLDESEQDRVEIEIVRSVRR